MLGFIGFTIAAALVIFFAVSFYVSFKQLPDQHRHPFSAAFLLLGLALFVWGFAPLINDLSWTVPLVFAGDILLVLGTGLLVAAQYKSIPLWLTVLLALVAAAILTLRAYAYAPMAFVQDDILHFNLEGAARYTIIAMLAFVWMPLGARITQLAVRSKGAPQFAGAIAFVYVMALLCAALFVSARQHTMVIATFAALAFSFLILALIPLVINKYALSQAKHTATKHEGARHGK